MQFATRRTSACVGERPHLGYAARMHGLRSICLVTGWWMTLLEPILILR
jgi:hypothetical protein